MRLRNAKDLLAGLLFIGFGLAFLIAAQSYPMGSARRMGPAYFPVVLALILIGLGALTAARTWLVEGAPIRPFAAKALLLVSASVAAFGLLVQGAGVGAAVLGLVLVSAVASRNARPLQALLLGLALAAFCVLVFVKGLGLPFPALGPWLAG